MIRITFLIGNGFDLNVGLKTQYKDFYEYYIKKCPNDMLAKAIEQNYTDWSDLELGLGKYTKKIKPEDEDAFWRSEEKLEQELANYLEIQMETVNIHDDEKRSETALEMQRSLTEFTKELPLSYQQKINTLFDVTNADIVYSFITFNYTDILDECLNITKSVLSKPIGKHFCHGALSYSHSIGDVLHIHGTIEDEMVLGVNDEEQIANKDFIKKSLNKQLLIKEETIKRYNQSKINDARKFIDDSIAICVFGMSIGRTDKMWWQYICQWLQEKDDRILVIYVKTKEKKRIGKRTLFSLQDEMLNRLKNNADLSDVVWEQIYKQIYVKCNPHIFNFKIIDK